MPLFRLVGASILRDLFYCYMMSRMSCLCYVCMHLFMFSICYLFCISIGIQVT
ncbi:hypothetical protein Hdeb2414_s0027g00696331 [Helianthus debilis subsp. tardiflorus]